MEQTTFWTDLKRFLPRSYLITFVAGLAVGVLASGSTLAVAAIGIAGIALHAHNRARRGARAPARRPLSRS